MEIFDILLVHLQLYIFHLSLVLSKVVALHSHYDPSFLSPLHWTLSKMILSMSCAISTTHTLVYSTLWYFAWSDASYSTRQASSFRQRVSFGYRPRISSHYSDHISGILRLLHLAKEKLEVWSRKRSNFRWFIYFPQGSSIFIFSEL